MRIFRSACAESGDRELLRSPRTCAVLVLAMVASFFGSEVVPVRAATCSRAPTVGLEPRLAGGGRYLLSVPAGLKGDAPLLLDLHGYPGPAELEASSHPWNWQRHAKGYIVAYPERDLHAVSGDRTPELMWDSSRESRDVKFLRAVIADIKAKYCVNGSRIHIHGGSQGGWMSQRMACDAANVVASVGVYAAGDPAKKSPDVILPNFMRDSPCTPSRPIAVVMFHGTADQNAPMSWGLAARDAWGARLGCRTRTDTGFDGGVQVRLSTCHAGVEVLWRSYYGEDHFSTMRNHHADIRGRTLAFFAAHPLPAR